MPLCVGRNLLCCRCAGHIGPCESGPVVSVNAANDITAITDEYQVYEHERLQAHRMGAWSFLPSRGLVCTGARRGLQRTGLPEVLRYAGCRCGRFCVVARILPR